MKKLIILCAIALVFFSCSNDDNNESSMDTLIIGKWELIKTGETLETLQIVDNPGNCGVNILEFFKEGIGIESYYTFDNNKCEFYEDSGRWSINNNIITITGTERSNWIILELSKSSLIMKDAKIDEKRIRAYKR